MFSLARVDIFFIWLIWVDTREGFPTKRFLRLLLVFFAGKLGVQDYAVVYPPNGTPVSLGMNNLCPQNVKRSDRLNYNVDKLMSD